ncbi:MAG: hypothetical protein U1E46_07155 [Hyphomicrobiales bacterium]
MFQRAKTARTAPIENREPSVATEYALIASCFVVAIVTLICVIVMSVPAPVGG